MTPKKALEELCENCHWNITAQPSKGELPHKECPFRHISNDHCEPFDIVNGALFELESTKLALADWKAKAKSLQRQADERKSHESEEGTSYEITIHLRDLVARCLYPYDFWVRGYRICHSLEELKAQRGNACFLDLRSMKLRGRGGAPFFPTDSRLSWKKIFKAVKHKGVRK